MASDSKSEKARMRAVRARAELELMIEERLSNLEKILQEHLEAHKIAEEKVDVAPTN